MVITVKVEKEILKGMCGEKSTIAAYGLNIIDDIDEESGVPPDSTQYTHTYTQETVIEMIQILHEK